MSLLRDLARVALKRLDNVDSEYTASAWQNLASGMGGSNDRASYQMITGVAPLRPAVISRLILGDWIARRIVSARPYEAFRLGATVTYLGDSERDQKLVRAVQAECDRLLLWRRSWEAATWGGAYGGALIHVVTDDARVEDPLDLARVNRIYSLNVYDPKEALPHRALQLDPYADHQPRLWGEHEYYSINAQSMWIPRLDPSRVVTFGGLLTSRSERWEHFQGWDAPTLQPVWDQLREFAGANQSITRMLQTASQAVLKIPNLWELIVEGGKERLRNRLQATTMASSVGNTLPINADEEITFIERKFAGVKDLGEFQLLLVAGAAEMPATILFGRSPAGLNATGESDMAGWYSSVEARRAVDYAPPMTRVIQLAAHTQGAEDLEGWAVAWPSLERLDSLQQAGLEDTQATTDLTRISMGVPVELVLRHRYGTGEYRSTPPLLTEADLEKLSRPGALAEPDPDPGHEVLADPAIETLEPELVESPSELNEESEATVEEIVTKAVTLNGAQLASLMDMIRSAAARELPRDTVIELIVTFFSIDRDVAERILGPVGMSFVPVKGC